MIKKQYVEDVNKTLEFNIFMFSPVRESGVDITIPIKRKVWRFMLSKQLTMGIYAEVDTVREGCRWHGQ